MAGALVLFVALVMVSLRERGSDGITEFNSSIMLVIVWLMSQAVINSIGTPDKFLLAAKLQFVILIFVVVSLYNVYRRFGAARVDSLRFINQLLLIGFTAGIVLSDAFVVGVNTFEWGLEPIFDWPMLFPIAWLLLMAVMTATRMIRLWRKEPRSTQERQRISLLLWALGVFVFGFCVELLADLGIAMPPLSWLFVPLSMGLMAAAVWRHGLTVINRDTPLFQVLRQFQGGLVLLDNDGIVRVANPRALELLGIDAADAIRRPLLSLVRSDDPTQRLAQAFEPGQLQQELVCVVPSGRFTERRLRIVCSPVEGSRMRGFACRLDDLSAEQQQIDYATTRDLLSADTGLPTLKVLQAALARRDIDERLPAIGVVVVRMLDREDLIYSHGHTALQAMITHMSRQLIGLQRPGIALHALPHGGFALLLRDSEQLDEQALDLLTGEVEDVLKRPLLLAAEQLPIRHAVSCWSWRAGDAGAADGFGQWLRTRQAADTLASGEAMSASSLTVDDVKNALEQGAFIPLYSPQIDLRRGRIFGLQPIIVWNHPELGVMSLGGFTEVLQASGVYIEVHSSVLRQAIADLRGFVQVLDDQSLTLNIRPHSSTLAAYISTTGMTAVLDSLGDMAQQIVMTITPNLPLDASLLQAMHRLRHEGMHLELREFGVGNPSLTHVARLPLSGVRITRELYATGGDPEVQTRTVTAAVAAAESLGLYTAVDGVESIEQMRLLAAAGCRYATGPLYGEPMNAELTLATLLSPGVMEF